MIVLTERLSLTPVTDADAEDLVRLHADPNVAHWHAGSWSAADAHRWAGAMAERWQQEGIG